MHTADTTNATTGPKIDREAASTRSARWRVGTNQITASKRCTALFRRTPTGWILQHVRSVHLRQRGPSKTDLRTDISPEEVPDTVFRKVGLDRDDVTGGSHA